MFAAHNFLKRPSNFIKIHLQTPLPTKSYTSLPKLLGKIIYICTPKVPEKYVCSPWFSGKGPRASQQSTRKPHCLQNFTCQSLTFPKNIYDPYFLKKAPKLRYNPPVHPRLLPKKNFNFPQISKTHKHN
jgi:hypothetical protein